jgi:uncharacterized protein (DUF2141 family)
MNASFSRPLLACAGALLVSHVSAAEPPAPSSSAIVVAVGPLRSLAGSVACRLFKSASGFPYASNDTVTVRVKADAPSVRCAFQNVTPGTYAIVVLHDENDNRKLDKNRLGMPLEGYGVSNNCTHALAAPRWDEAKFAVERDRSRELTIAIRY